jgi:hypothetical protein
VLTEHQPDGLLRFTACDGPQQKIAAFDALSDNLLRCVLVAEYVTAEPGEFIIGVRRRVRDPESRFFGLDAQPQAGSGRVVLDAGYVNPLAAVVADDGRRISRDCALVGFVVVLAREAFEIECDLREWSSIDAEIIPARLTISTVLIFLSVDSDAEVLVVDFLNALGRATFEVGMNFRREAGGAEKKGEQSQARISFIRLPDTSVRRMSRPLCRYVSFS